MSQTPSGEIGAEYNFQWIVLQCTQYLHVGPYHLFLYGFCTQSRISMRGARGMPVGWMAVAIVLQVTISILCLAFAIRTSVLGEMTVDIWYAFWAFPPWDSCCFLPLRCVPCFCAVGCVSTSWIAWWEVAGLVKKVCYANVSRNITGFGLVPTLSLTSLA